MKSIRPTHRKIRKALKFWACLFFLLTTVLLSGQDWFENTHFLTHNVYNHLVMDMDNDGDEDIIARGDDFDRDFVWYENADSQGSLWVTHLIEIPDSIYLNRITLGDVNGDGWIDLISPQSYTFLHNGDPANVSFNIVLNNLENEPYSIADDLDGDGDPDLLTWNYSTQGESFKWYENIQQDGTFGPPQILESVISGQQHIPRQAKISDMDGDGDPDILVSVESSTENDSLYIAWYENTDGQGNFEVFEIIDSGFLGPHINIADFNGDNLKDIIASENDSLGIYFQQNNGTWTYQLINENLWFVSIRSGVVIHDLDNDGDLDFIEKRKIGQLLYWYENINNTGSFILTPIPDTLDAIVFDSFQLADFDSDGFEDISFSNSSVYRKDGVFWFKNDLSNNNIGDVIQVSDNINGYLKPFVADLDNDLDNDVLFHSRLDQTVHWCRNQDSLGDFSEPILLIDEQITNALFEDLDGDGDHDIIGINTSQELVWYENTSDTTVQFASKQVLQNGVFSENTDGLIAGLISVFFAAADYDNDGDLDIAAHRSTDKAIFLYEQISPNQFSPILVSSASDSLEVIGFADLDNDNLKDIVYRNYNFGQEEIGYYKYEPGGTFTAILLHSGLVRTIKIEDLDEDQDEDLVLINDTELHVRLNEPSGLNDYLISSYSTDEDFAFSDIDNDGKKDIIGNYGWYKQLNNSTNFSPRIDFSLLPWGSGFVATGDLNSDGDQDFIYTFLHEDGLTWTPNQYAEGFWIEGRVAFDQDEDCILTASDTIGHYGWIIEFTQGDLSYHTSTSPDGYYAAFIPETGDFTAHLNLPNNYWNTCFNDSLLTIIDPDSTTYLNFLTQSAYDCPLMQVDVASSWLRPCMDGTISIQYCNEGTIATDSAQVEVVLDSFLNFNSANFPYEETDSSLIFDLGEVDLLECGSIQLSVTPDCDSTEVGDIVCTTAYITPDSLCIGLDSLWDGSTIEVNGFCLNDSIHFELKNTGVGAMDEARLFRVEIVNDDIVLLILADTFLLAPEEKKLVVVDSEMEVMRLEADQDENHPVLTTASTLVSGCAEFDIALNLLPQNNGNPFSETHCRELTGSYDPNLKEASPLGYGPENLVDRAWELDYTILFQNTGNDTAFNVVIRDTISAHLNLSTLRIGAASHPFTWKLNTERVLSFTFENILLPDSTTNGPASNGFVHFFISPLPTTPFGTVIQNHAAIHFDFNDPVITNTTSRTIRTPVSATSTHFELCEGDTFMGHQILSDTLVVDSTLTVEGLNLAFNHIQAIPVFTAMLDSAITYGDYFNGMQIYQDTLIEILVESISGCDSLVIYNLSIITNTKNPDTRKDIKVFPIPTTNNAYIQWNPLFSSPVRVSIIASDGRPLNQRMVPEAHHGLMDIQLTELPRGVYWFKIDLPDGSVYRRIVKI